MKYERETRSLEYKTPDHRIHRIELVSEWAGINDAIFESLIASFRFLGVKLEEVDHNETKWSLRSHMNINGETEPLELVEAWADHKVIRAHWKSSTVTMVFFQKPRFEIVLRAYSEKTEKVERKFSLRLPTLIIGIE